MVESKKAPEELFRRTTDESFDSWNALRACCAQQRDDSRTIPCGPRDVAILRDMTVALPGASALRLNDWSFTQLCRLAGVSRGTINRLSPRTAARVLAETLRKTDRRLHWQIGAHEVRSVRAPAGPPSLNDALLEAVGESWVDFRPLQTRATRKATGRRCGQQDLFHFPIDPTGLHCGEQDLFCFLIDPAGWIEIGGDAFAPGFFVWNSEVGRRAPGIQSFWYQHLCRNHVVWDPVSEVEVERPPRTGVRDRLAAIRRTIHALRQQRAARRDRFAKVLRKALVTRLGEDSEAVARVLARLRIPRNLAQSALEMERERREFTIFALVDDLTRLTRANPYVADRTATDARIARLLDFAD